MRKWILAFFAVLGGTLLLFWPSEKKPHQPKVYDCFLFYNELELLEIRLNELYDHVDKFVLVEASETFRGKPKPFYFAENKHLFEKFADKIIYVPLNETFKTDDPFKRERHQRSQVLRGLKQGHPEDVVFISDLDEILRGKRVEEIAEQIRSKKAEAVICEMTMYNGFLNRYQTDGWRGPVCTTLGYMKKISPALARRIRNLRPRKLRKAELTKVEIAPQAGWHFTSMGGLDKIIQKIESFSHAECDTPANKDKQKLSELIKSFPLKPIDETFPQYVQQNQPHFEEIGFIDKE